jgi:hypothetical protein
MTAHPKSKALFDLAQPFSFIMQGIEQGAFNDATGAALLYTPAPGNTTQTQAEVVIDQYSLATGRDLKATAVLERPVQRKPVAQMPLLTRAPAETNGRSALSRA